MGTLSGKPVYCSKNCFDTKLRNIIGAKFIIWMKSVSGKNIYQILKLSGKFSLNFVFKTYFAHIMRVIYRNSLHTKKYTRNFVSIKCKFTNMHKLHYDVFTKKYTEIVVLELYRKHVIHIQDTSQKQKFYRKW